MKKRLLFAALFSAALVSCTKDQVVEVQQDEIKFNVVAANATKAAAVYCSNNPITSFEVWSEYTSDATIQTPVWNKYFADESVEYSNGSWSSTNVRYWPNLSDGKGSLRFYAVAGATKAVPGDPITYVEYDLQTGDAEWSGNGTAPVIKGFEPRSVVAQQEDLLFSVQQYKERPTDGKAVLNFRHALSQIEFKAKNTSYALYVNITGVSVGNIKGTGDFTLPTVSTSSNWTVHGTGAVVDDNSDQNNDGAQHSTRGSWALSGNAEKVYTVSGLNVNINNTSDEAFSLSTSTDDNSQVAEEVKNSMLLLPQNTEPVAPATAPTSYIAVKCSIWNKAVPDAASVTTANEVKLYEGWAVVPVAFDWKPGKKYIYTFVFGNGNGGTEGGDGEDPVPGTDPVLVPIDYTVTIDDFDLIGSNDFEIDMDQE